MELPDPYQATEQSGGPVTTAGANDSAPAPVTSAIPDCVRASSRPG